MPAKTKPKGKARRLTDREAREVRQLRHDNPGQPLTWLAWLYEVTDSAIHKVITGQSHKDAGGPIVPVRVPSTSDEIIAIREMRARGMAYKDISGKTGKKESALRSICSGKSFPRVGGPLTAHREYKKG